ncbi:uncharacterized protein [Littorina saxatilis]|uniref:uncharacterized protein n=1 Tax=Littorina saxatilis TaxID=31220 RepID=UPI0038B42746
MTSPSWTLRANTTITTVLSLHGRYSCVWYTEPQSGASVGSDMSPTLSPNASDASDLSNRTGWCSSSWTMPLTPSTYSYVVVASPGETKQSAGSVIIERPENPSLGSGCPVDYVPEFSAVTCTCITSSLGSPPGVIGWSHDMSSSVLTLPNVTMSDNNTNFTCDVKWSSLTLHTSLNLRVSSPISTTPGDKESRSSSTLVIGLGVAGCVCVVMAAVGFYCFRKRRPGGQNDAPPDNGPQGADTAGASTGQTVPTTPGAELDESSEAGSEASEASEATIQDTASHISIKFE